MLPCQHCMCVPHVHSVRVTILLGQVWTVLHRLPFRSDNYGHRPVQVNSPSIEPRACAEETTGCVDMIAGSALAPVHQRAAHILCLVRQGFICGEKVHVGYESLGCAHIPCFVGLTQVLSGPPRSGMGLAALLLVWSSGAVVHLLHHPPFWITRHYHCDNHQKVLQHLVIGAVGWQSPPDAAMGGSWAGVQRPSYIYIRQNEEKSSKASREKGVMLESDLAD